MSLAPSQPSAASATSALNTPPAASPQLLVADSFRVRGVPGNASVRGFTLHVERFRRSVLEVCADSPTAKQTGQQAGQQADKQMSEQRLDEFLRDAAQQINAYGEGNPRLELWLDAAALRLSLAQRPLPELREVIELRSTPEIPLIRPQHKGPNIETFTALNRELGAEALLTDAAGNVAEGATTAIVWWEGDHCFTVAHSRRVSSVAEALVTKIAAARGIAVERAAITAALLATHEVWAVNALHGIRPVAAVDTIQAPTGSIERLTEFREAFDTMWEPVTQESLTQTV